MIASEIPSHRLYHHRITQEKLDQSAQVVSWFGAMQAQDYASAKWGVGLRCYQATLTAIEREIAEASILRTWLLRGTLHLVAAADVHWILKLISPKIIAGSARRRQQLGLDAETLIQSHDILTRALTDSPCLKRNELMLALEQEGISTKGQRGYHILGQAALEGIICFGPLRDKQDTFVLLSEWTSKRKALEGDEALGELAKRYFQSHGPATLRDFVFWSGLKVADARKGLEIIETDLRQENIDGQTYWESQGRPVIQESSPAIHLLPAFDEYYLGYSDRSTVLDPQYDKTVVSSNGMFRPTIVQNGKIIGTWKKTTKKDLAVITPNLFKTLSDTENRELLAAAHQYGEFLGTPVALIDT